MRIIATAIALTLLCLVGARPAEAQTPIGSRGGVPQLRNSQTVDIGAIDAVRLRQIRTERTRQFILGTAMMTVGGMLSVSKQNWEPIDESVVGMAVAVVGLAAVIEPLTWRRLQVRPAGPGFSLSW